MPVSFSSLIPQMPQSSVVKSNLPLNPFLKFGDWYPEVEALDVYVKPKKEENLNTELRAISKGLKKTKNSLETNLQSALDTEETAKLFATTQGARVVMGAFSVQAQRLVALQEQLLTLKSSPLLNEAGRTFMESYKNDFSQMMDKFQREIELVTSAASSDAGAGVAMLKPMRSHQERFNKMAERFDSIFQHV